MGGGSGEEGQIRVVAVKVSVHMKEVVIIRANKVVSAMAMQISCLQ